MSELENQHRSSTASSADDHIFTDANDSRASSPLSSVTSHPDFADLDSLPLFLPRETIPLKSQEIKRAEKAEQTCEAEHLPLTSCRWSGRQTKKVRRYGEDESERIWTKHVDSKDRDKKRGISETTSVCSDSEKSPRPRKKRKSVVKAPSKTKVKKTEKSIAKRESGPQRRRSSLSKTVKKRPPPASARALPRSRLPAKHKSIYQRPAARPFELSGDFADHGDYEQLLDISRRMMIKTDLHDKPLPRGKPRVWADSRQALCETCLYYQAWQGACYISKGILMSFMFDSNGHERDVIDEDVVIARAGGAMSRDRVTSEMVQIRDQKDNSQSEAVRTAITLQSPLVIFCGSENTDIVSRMPHRYCALGWYKATHVWTERNLTSHGNSFEQIKYRFEKLSNSDTQPSWWMPIESTGIPRVGDLDPPQNHKCPSCQQEFQKIYLEGWMCLNTVCDRFWLLPDLKAPDEQLLNYDPRFLKQKTPWACETPPYDMRPALPDPGQRMGEDVTYAMTRGMGCPQCGKCSSRVKWRGWVCSGCGFQHQPEHVLISARSIRDPYHPTSYGFAQSVDWVDRLRVRTRVDFTHNYRVMHYEIPGIDGQITHMLANRVVNEEKHGPDEMFEALQTEEIDLERRSFTIGREEYMTAFSSNRGMPYKFVASVDTKPFEGSPWPLTAARSRMNWAAKTVLGGVDKKSSTNYLPSSAAASGPAPVASGHDFNELLTIGYFGGQKINYHDDGETGLGPTVATLSLGMPADMLFRVKAKHMTGVSKSGVMTENRPLPGTSACEARLAALKGFADRKFVSHNAKVDWLVSTAKKLGLSPHGGTEKRPWMRLRLSHGDIVIMHGREIQEYMENQFESIVSLRFALTCRTILPEHLKSDEMPDYEVAPDDGSYDGSAISEMRAGPPE